MSDPFIGQIIAFAGNFAPDGWVMCDGSLLSISQYQALYSLLGTTYGGDGQNTFGVPDLRGRMIVGAGSGPVGSFPAGQQAGATSVNLNSTQLPLHTHQLYGQPVPATSSSPAGNLSANLPASGGQNLNGYAPPSAGTPVAMAGSALAPAGANSPMPTAMPFTCINNIMAWDGIYPSRP